MSVPESLNGEPLNGNVLQGPNLANSLIGVLIRFHQETVDVMADLCVRLCFIKCVLIPMLLAL